LANNHSANARVPARQGRKTAFLLELQRSGRQFSSSAAWRFFESNNIDGVIECYRREFATLLDLMSEWRFEQIAIDRMMQGAALESSVSHAQLLLDEQARKRVMTFLYRPCKKAPVPIRP
jgi:hypothetical protein